MALPGVLAPLYLPHYDIGFRLGPLACCWGCVSGVRRLRILLYSQFAPPLVSCSRSKLIRWVSGLIYVASCPEFVVSVVSRLSGQLKVDFPKLQNRKPEKPKTIETGETKTAFFN